MGKDFHPPDGRSYEVDKDGNVIAIDGVKVKKQESPKLGDTLKKKKGAV